MRSGRLVKAPVDRIALHLQQLVQAVLQVVHHRRQVEAVKGVPPLLPQLLKKIAQTLEPVAHLAAHAALQQVAHRVLQVAEVHKVVRQRFEQLIGVERRDFLCAVPFAVSECDH